MDAPRILVVDDSLTIRRALEFILRPHGYALEFAADGQQALSQAAEFAPDLVLLDYVLPDMRAPDVCAALCTVPATAATPVILVSAKGASIRQAYQDADNVVSYITKPFKAEVVTAVVANALARQRAARTEQPLDAGAGQGPGPGGASEGAADRGAIRSLPRRAAPCATIEETFGALLAQLEDAIAGNLGAGARRDGEPGGHASREAGSLARLGPRLGRASQRMAELVEHLTGRTILPYRLRRDGSFASLAETLLSAHRALCEAAIALIAAGGPGIRPSHTTAVVVAFPPDHPLGCEVHRALDVAPEIAAIVVDGEFGQLPYLVRLLAPRCVVVASGCDAALDDAWQRTRAAAAEGTRFVALGSAARETAGEAGFGERLEDASAVARLVGELALGLERGRPNPGPAEPIAIGLEVVTL